MSVKIEGFESSKVLEQVDAWLKSLDEEKRQAQVKKIKGVFQLDLKNKDGVKTWTLDLKDKGEVYIGKPKSKADLIFQMDDANFVKLSKGDLKGQNAFMTGKLKLKGQMMLATKLEQVFAAIPKAKL